MVLSNCTFSNGMPKIIGDVFELLEPWFENASGEAQPSSVTISLLDKSFGKVRGLLQVSENKSLILLRILIYNTMVFETKSFAIDFNLSDEKELHGPLSWLQSCSSAS